MLEDLTVTDVRTIATMDPSSVRVSQYLLAVLPSVLSHSTASFNRNLRPQRDCEGDRPQCSIGGEARVQHALQDGYFQQDGACAVQLARKSRIRGWSVILSPMINLFMAHRRQRDVGVARDGVADLSRTVGGGRCMKL